MQCNEHSHSLAKRRGSHIIKENPEADNLTSGPFLVQHIQRMQEHCVCVTHSRTVQSSPTAFPTRGLLDGRSNQIRACTARYEATWVSDGCFDRCEHGAACEPYRSRLCLLVSRPYPDNELTLFIRKRGGLCRADVEALRPWPSSIRAHCLRGSYHSLVA